VSVRLWATVPLRLLSLCGDRAVEKQKIAEYESGVQGEENNIGGLRSGTSEQGIEPNTRQALFLKIRRDTVILWAESHY
jgi:hypothetical protein